MVNVIHFSHKKPVHRKKTINKSWTIPREQRSRERAKTEQELTKTQSKAHWPLRNNFTSSTSFAFTWQLQNIIIIKKCNYKKISVQISVLQILFFTNFYHFLRKEHLHDNYISNYKIYNYKIYNYKICNRSKTRSKRHISNYKLYHLHASYKLLVIWQLFFLWKKKFIITIIKHAHNSLTFSNISHLQALTSTYKHL